MPVSWRQFVGVQMTVIETDLCANIFLFLFLASARQPNGLAPMVYRRQKHMCIVYAYTTCSPGSDGVREDHNNRSNVAVDAGALCPVGKTIGRERVSAGDGLSVRLVVPANKFQTDLLRTFRRHNNLFTTCTKVYISVYFFYLHFSSLYWFCPKRHVLETYAL